MHDLALVIRRIAERATGPHVWGEVASGDHRGVLFQVCGSTVRPQ